MADQQNQATTDQLKGNDFNDSQSQSSYDQGFQSLMTQQLQGLDATSQIVAAYFDSIEQQTRTARRVAEVWATSMILQQTRVSIVNEVTQRVLAQVKQQDAAR